LGIAFNEMKTGLNPDAPYDLRANQQQSRACYESALAIYAPGSRDWAMTQNNLGAALSAQAGLAEGAARAALLEQAVAAYRAALTVRTRESAAPDWAATQNNLGNALRAQAELAEGAARAALLEQAVAAYRAALTVYTRESAAPAWAATQFNLALAYCDLANDSPSAAAATEHLRAALVAARGAHEVWEGSDLVNAAQAARLCQAIEEALGKMSGGQ
jgi:tetratricopeptide (TPR) repeat protein